MTFGRPEVARALNALESRLSHTGVLGANQGRAEVDRAIGEALPESVVIGLTGPPGAGKSTLAGKLIEQWRQADLTVGVLCIDPSSRASGGALLGDRLRMRIGGTDPGVFVRSMAARDRLGGLAPATLEATIVMRAAFDRVLVETVGVGQSEVEVSDVADLTIVVVQPGSGDALQFVKAGLMEVFDLLVVNKADLGALAEIACRELRHALRVRGRRDEPVIPVSSETGSGVAAVVMALDRLYEQRKPGLAARRAVALRAATLNRFVEWHGLASVVRVGGLARLRAMLDAQPQGATPSHLESVLESVLDEDL